ncbi:hypothetical protein M885DRAFT_512676 [Pelagophyceae sp. CCMP2097]|nr:hypothetical protein M885DRAFT_512676 [Pelagophyceae sp. CCMP2097]
MSKAGSKDETDERSVVLDLLNFAMRVVHEDLASFFDEHCGLWDYSEADLQNLGNGGGESMQQHAVFVEYCERMNCKLDEFASSAGYGTARDVFDKVQAALEVDKAQRTKMMSELQSMFSKFKLKTKCGAEAKEAKADDGEAKEAKAEAKAGDGTVAKKKAAPMMMFSQPIGLEYLLESVLKLADYETLRMLMLMKARERKMLRDVERKAADRLDEQKDRRRALGASSPPKASLVAEYAALRERLCRLTPHHAGLHEGIRAAMPLDDFESRCSADRPADSAEFYDGPVDHLLKLCSLNSTQQLADEAAALKADGAADPKWLLALHEAVDRVHEDVERALLASRPQAAGKGAGKGDAAQAK